MPRGNQGTRHQLLEPVDPSSEPLNESNPLGCCVEKVRVGLMLPVCEKSLSCLDTFTFIGCFCPITFYPLGEVKMTSEDRRSGSRGKIQGGRERELNHREQLVSTHSCSPLGRAQGCSVSFPWLESGNFRCVYPWSRDYGPWVPPKGLLPFSRLRITEAWKPLVNSYLLL